MDGIEKKFHNIKQSAKAKSDELNHPPTGGGRRIICTPAEEMWIDALEARKNPTIHGVPGGVDVNELSTNNTDFTFLPIDFSEENGYTFSIDHAELPPVGPVILELPEKSLPTTCTTSSAPNSATINACDVRRKRKRTSEDKESLEMDILRMEKEKLSLELQYLKQKVACFEERKSLWRLKEKFYKKFLTSPED